MQTGDADCERIDKLSADGKSEGGSNVGPNDLPPSDNTATTNTGSPPNAKSTVKIVCVFCQKRNATKDCPEKACTTCCPASAEACPKHAAMRAKQTWKSQVLEGTTVVQQLAAEKRRALLPKNRFRESGFVYTGDTVVIWNLREYYYAHPKWRDEARRRSKRRQQIEQDALAVSDIGTNKFKKRIYCNRKRFRRWVESKYQEHLQDSKIKHSA